MSEILARRSTWTRQADHQIACCFGNRRHVLTLGAGRSAEQLAMMVLRAEIRVLLGDAEAPLVAHLQAFAEQELRRLF